MINLIKTELLRLINLRILPFLLLLSLAFSYVILDKLFGNSIDTANFLSSGQAAFPYSFSTNVTILGPAIFGGFYLGSDFTQRTLQQQVANGHSRKALVLAKGIVFSVISFGLMMITPIVTTGVVTLVKGWGADFISETASYMLRVFLLAGLLSISTLGIYSLISFICKDIFKTIFFSLVFTVLFNELGELLVKEGTIFGIFYDFFPLNQLPLVFQREIPMMDLVKMLLSSTLTWLIVVVSSIVIFESQDLD